MTLDSELISQVQPLLDSVGLSTDILSIDPCAHGGNNRTYRLITPDGMFALKKYFREASDTRDRLSAEFSFLKYAKQVAPQWVPKPYASDLLNGIALYEFVQGHPIKLSDLAARDVDNAADFFCALNAANTSSLASHLPLASESCFSIREHIDIIHQRVLALKTLNDAMAAKTIHMLCDRWDRVREHVLADAKKEAIDIDKKLSPSERAISPSDFGFHNALRLADGSLRFIDFEYAGWDDPAKMAGDFFSQLAIPVPVNYFAPFMQKIATSFNDPAQLIKRAEMLRAAYKIKWCCIALNVFIPVNLARRQFANPLLNADELKLKQLAKADHLLLELR